MAARKTSTKSAPVVLKSICKDLNMEPKAARRKLRKAGLSFHSAKERWVIPAAQVAKVKETLRA